MNQGLRIFLISLTIVFGIFLLWYFSAIVAYVIIAAIVSLLGRPIVDFTEKIKIKTRQIPRWFSAIIALSFIWIVFLGLLIFLIPLIASELQNLSTIDTNTIITSLREPIAYFEAFVSKYQLNTENFTVAGFVSNKLISIFNVSFITVFLGNLASVLGNIFVAIFSVSFISFFFLRDENLLSGAVLSLVPDKFEEAFKRAITSAKNLLGRYFVGLLLQITGVFVLLTIGLTIMGVGLSHSLLIGLIAALFNIIPYLGPIIGIVIGILLGIATHLHLDFYNALVPLTLKMLAVFTIVQMIDNMIFQPVIFSNSVKAHPLEIFLVIMMAGSFAGISGMVFAIPAYTILKVFAKEFLSNLKVVKKLTSKIE